MRALAGACVAALVVFWGAVLLGGAVEPAYSHAADYVSRLASFGAQAPWIGVVAISALATAHLAGAGLLRRAESRVAAVALAGAAAAGYAVAAFRIHCPGGAAGCAGSSEATDTWTDTVHGLAVGAYEVGLLVAMLATAWWVARRRRHQAGGWIAVPSALLAVASLVSVLAIGGPDAGAEQRAWLAVSTVWLLLLLAAAGTVGPEGTLTAGGSAPNHDELLPPPRPPSR